MITQELIAWPEYAKHVRWVRQQTGDGGSLKMISEFFTIGGSA